MTLPFGFKRCRSRCRPRSVGAPGRIAVVWLCTILCIGVPLMRGGGVHAHQARPIPIGPPVACLLGQEHRPRKKRLQDRSQPDGARRLKAAGARPRSPSLPLGCRCHCCYCRCCWCRRIPSICAQTPAAPAPPAVTHRIAAPRDIGAPCGRATRAAGVFFTHASRCTTNGLMPNSDDVYSRGVQARRAETEVVRPALTAPAQRNERPARASSYGWPLLLWLCTAATHCTCNFAPRCLPWRGGAGALFSLLTNMAFFDVHALAVF